MANLTKSKVIGFGADVLKMSVVVALALVIVDQSKKMYTKFSMKKANPTA